jgi:hypothetical protein
VGAVLTLNGQVVAQLAAGGSQGFTAVAGTYQVFAAGTAAASPGTGSYSVQVTGAGAAPVFGMAQAVTTTGGASAYSFGATIPSAGTYTVTDTDFQFPAPLTSLTLAVVQGGAILGTPLTQAASADVQAAAGPLSLLVFTQPAAGTGGLFGIDLAPKAGGAATFAVTQGVGELFIARQITITAAGNYAVTATDLGFPADFANYDTVVTQGATKLGSIFGGGTFSITATPGTYFVNFIAQPMGADEAGTYALTVASAPAAPTVSLTADHTQISSGGTVDLIWSSTNATSCVASGGWSGAQALMGTTTSAALTTSTTFTLTCTGPGGSKASSVTVTVTAASGGGGGGDLGFEALAGLLALVLLRATARGVPRGPRLPAASPPGRQRDGGRR